MRYYRKVIKITAEDSPNVRLGLLQERQGKTPTNETLVPGVLSYDLYRKRRYTWDKVRQCIGLDANWWQGADLFLFPPEWLDRCNRYASFIRRHFGSESEEWSRRKVKSIGIDTGQGISSTSMSAVDDYGLKELSSFKTPDTSVSVDLALMFMARHNCRGEQVWFDGGGGGKEIADQLRRKGHRVNVVFFQENITPRPKYGRTTVKDRREVVEERYTFLNRRAEMYYTLRLLMNPSKPLGNEAFTIPEEYTNLREELAPMPLLYDKEQKIKMLPKNKSKPDSDEPCLIDLIGHSPDEADSLVLACHGLRNKPRRKIGAA